MAEGKNSATPAPAPATPKSVIIAWILGILLIISVITNIATYSVSHNIGDKETKNSEEGNEINIVYIGASSRIYHTHDSTTPLGSYIELLSLNEIAELIDRDGFPVPLQYWAETPSTERYLVKLKLEGDPSPQEYWIELPKIEEATTPQT